MLESWKDGDDSWRKLFTAPEGAILEIQTDNDTRVSCLHRPPIPCPPDRVAAAFGCLHRPPDAAVRSER
jgi:hypothetical protein